MGRGVIEPFLGLFFVERCVMFEVWGHFVYRFRWPTFLGALALVIASVLAIGRLNMPLSTAYGDDPRMEARRALALADRELPSQVAGFTLLFTANDPNLRASDPAFAAAMERALAPLRTDPRITQVVTDPTFVSRDGRRAFAVVGMRGELPQAQEEWPAVRALVRSDDLGIMATGQVPLNVEWVHVSERDLQRAEIVGLPIALVVLLGVFGAILWRALRRSSLRRAALVLALAFGSLGIALLPLLVGVFTILGGLAGIYALAHERAMSIYALNIASMIGLGLAIDYSLFVIARFFDELERQPVGPAVARTVATSGQAVAFSGLTVAIGVAGLLFYHDTSLTSIGIAAMLVVVAAVGYALTFLPALLAIVGDRVAGHKSQVTSRPAPTDLRPVDLRPATRPGLWHRLALGVMRRPWLTLLPLLALLLVAGSPFLRLRLGYGDATSLPTGMESRQAFEILTSEFAGGEGTRVDVIVHYPEGVRLDAARIGQLQEYAGWLAGLPHVSRVGSAVAAPGPDGRALAPEVIAATLAAPRESLPAEVRRAIDQTVGAHVIRLSVSTPLGPDSDGARGLVRAIRDGRDAGRIPPGATVLVGGDTAFGLDSAASVKGDTPRAALFVGVTTYLVLFLLLGSVVLPLKAILMNLLSLTASYGALVWIFQEGNLSGILNFTPASINPTTPILMFCLLFGLSMDYEVLLLSRMKEAHDRTGDNTLAVAEGLEETGRLITGAAAIMVGVFGAFALADLVVLKAIGLGMALAVGLDAAIVRTFIVPATMRLLGELNWWAPAPLARLHRRIGFSHEGGAPAPQPTGD
jgi:putative drug exporter of the RND superfamily